MLIQFSADHHLEDREALASEVNGVVEHALSRFSAHITRVEVHLSDENSQKGGQNDKRCMIEARLEGHQPVAVTHHAASLDHALVGAADKLAKLIAHTRSRLHEHGRHRQDQPLSEPLAE